MKDAFDFMCHSTQARAHTLLKSKDQELKNAKDAAESAAASDLESARKASREANEELEKVTNKLVFHMHNCIS